MYNLVSHTVHNTFNKRSMPGVLKSTRYRLLHRFIVYYILRHIIMRQGRGNEATEAVFCLQAKKPLPSGSYERRVPNVKIKIIFCTRDVCLSVFN